MRVFTSPFRWSILLALVGLLSTALVGLLLPLSMSFADTSSQISYQGRLRSRANGELENGNRTMQFIIYGAVDSWDSGNLTVPVRNGLFNVLLDIDLAINFNDAPYELEIIVEGQSLGREPLVAVPMAINADMLDGHHWDDIASLFGPENFIENKFQDLTLQEDSSFWVSSLGRVGDNSNNITIGELGNRITASSGSLDLNALSGNVTIGLDNPDFDSQLQVGGDVVVGFNNNRFDNQLLTNGVISTRNGSDGIDIGLTDPHTISSAEADLTLKSMGDGSFYFGNTDTLANLNKDGDLTVSGDIALRQNFLDDADDGRGIAENSIVDVADDADRLDDMESEDFIWNYTNTGTPQDTASFNVGGDSFVGGNLTIGGNFEANNFPVTWGDTLLFGNQATTDLFMERFRIIDTSWIGDEDEPVEIRLWGSSVADQGAGLDLSSGNGWIDAFSNLYVEGVVQTDNVESSAGDLTLNFPDDRDNVRIGGEGETKRLFVYHTGDWGEVYHTRNFNWNAMILNQNLNPQNPGNFWIGGTGRAGNFIANNTVQGNQLRGNVLNVNNNASIGGNITVGGNGSISDQLQVGGNIRGGDNLTIENNIVSRSGDLQIDQGSATISQGNLDVALGDVTVGEGTITANEGDIVALEGEAQANIVRAIPGADDPQFCLDEDCVTSWPRGFWFNEPGTNFIFPNDPEDAASRDAAENWQVSIGSADQPDGNHFLQVWREEGIRIGQAGEALDLGVNAGVGEIVSDTLVSIQPEQGNALLTVGTGTTGIGDVEDELGGDYELTVGGDIAWGGTDASSRAFFRTEGEVYEWQVATGEILLNSSEVVRVQTGTTDFLTIDNEGSTFSLLPNAPAWTADTGVFLTEEGKVGVGVSEPQPSPSGVESVLNTSNDGILVGNSGAQIELSTLSNADIQSHGSGLHLNRNNDNVIIGRNSTGDEANGNLFVEQGKIRVGKEAGSEYLDLYSDGTDNFIESARGVLNVTSLQDYMNFETPLSRVAVGEDDVDLRVGQSGTAIEIDDDGTINSFGGSELLINGDPAASQLITLGEQKFRFDLGDVSLNTNQSLKINDQTDQNVEIGGFGRTSIVVSPTESAINATAGGSGEILHLSRFGSGFVRVGEVSDPGTSSIDLINGANPIIQGRSVFSATPLVINPDGRPLEVIDSDTARFEKEEIVLGGTNSNLQVGVGTNSPNARLDIAGDSTNEAFQVFGDKGDVNVEGSDGNFVFYNSGYNSHPINCVQGCISFTGPNATHHYGDFNFRIHNNGHASVRTDLGIGGGLVHLGNRGHWKIDAKEAGTFEIRSTTSPAGVVPVIITPVGDVGIADDLGVEGGNIHMGNRGHWEFEAEEAGVFKLDSSFNSGAGVHGVPFAVESDGDGNFAKDLGLHGGGLYLGPGGPWLVSGANSGQWTVSTRNGGTVDNRLRLQDNGDLFIDGTYHCNGADLAEMVSGRIRFGRVPEPGDVVIIDPERDESIVLGNKAYDTRVAGVVSTDPGIVLAADQSEELTLVEMDGEEYPLALVGRVPVKVTNENGPIQRGDLMVTSSKPGYAMRADEEDLGFGMIIGKAMEEFDQKEGEIVVLVNLQ